jgi:hypothetical protein
MGEVQVSTTQPDLERLSEEWERRQESRGENERLLAQAHERLSELIGYGADIDAELGRLRRMRESVDLLADLQVTHCPACDQAVRRQAPTDVTCFLCGQSTNGQSSSTSARERRIQFEEEQLFAEREEIDELIETISADIAARQDNQQQLDGELRAIDAEMQPFKRAAAAVIPPELERADQEMGSLRERSRIISRLVAIVDEREERSKRIDELSAQAKRLNAQVIELEAGLNLEARSDALSEAMNSYLNALNDEYPETWTMGRVSVQLREKSFSVKVGGEPWAHKLGGTLAQYLFLSYHYALISLTHVDGCNYPGLAILDFPAPIENSVSIADKENFVLNPFVSLLGREGMADTQLIAAGSVFEGLENANRIRVTDVWT